MGCFDSLYVDCPKCNTPVEWQSKAGKCYLNQYTINDLPPAIAGDLHNQSARCDNCGTVLVVHTNVRVTVSMKKETDGEHLNEE